MYTRVISKSHRNHGTATTAHRTLGLMPAGTMCRSNLSLGFYPIQVFKVTDETVPLSNRPSITYLFASSLISKEEQRSHRFVDSKDSCLMTSAAGHRWFLTS